MACKLTDQVVFTVSLTSLSLSLPPLFFSLFLFVSQRICQLVNSLSGNGLLTQAAQVISAAQTAATTAQNIGSIASLLHQLSSPSTDQSSKSMISQLANILTGDIDGVTSPASTQSATPAAASAAASAPLSGTSNFNPVIAVLDYLASNSQEKSGGISTLLPARRKKPADLEELASEAASVASSLNTNRIPPTPCPSLEEYIAPVFARNYQGVWKYIVQIPHEGYFTQTVQKTSCIKTKCDFMDGSCHEVSIQLVSCKNAYASLPLKVCLSFFYSFFLSIK